MIKIKIKGIMKKFFVIILSLVILGSCSSKRYLLSDNNADKSFLVNTLKEAKSKGLISKKPIVVVDGVPYRYEHELKRSPLGFSKSEIMHIEILKRDVGISIYGDFAKDGVVVITTNRNQKPFDESKILILLEDKTITMQELESMDPNDIESIEVIKNKEIIKNYTSKDYDGVIIINRKK